MIDGGPLRTSRLTGRQVAYRNESARYQPDEEQLEPADRQPRKRQEQPRREEEPEKQYPRKRHQTFNWAKWVIGLILLALLGTGAWLLVNSTQQNTASTIDTDKYQAVVLSNGETYFGRMSFVNNDFIKLTNVFFLKQQMNATTSSEGQDDASSQPTDVGDSFQLLKYSEVLYGSEDAMIISSDDIVRFENLRTDGVVSKAIANRR